MGLYRTSSLGGCHYFLCVVDDYSRAIWFYLLKDKIEVSEKLISFCSMVNTRFDLKVQRIRSDNGREFMNDTLHTYFRQHGIIQESSCVDTPQQNGRVEWKNRHILNVARALRFQASLPINFWGECVLIAAYLINRTLTKYLTQRHLMNFCLVKGLVMPTLKHLDDCAMPTTIAGVVISLMLGRFDVCF